MEQLSISDIIIKLELYRYGDQTASDIYALLTNFNTLQVENAKEFVHPDGTTENLVSVTGTIPVGIQGNQYYVPIAIWLKQTHPYHCPIVYVTPTQDMGIQPSWFVDNSGRVNLPYLNEWTQDSSDLTALTQVMCATFVDFFPVYSLYSVPGQLESEPPQPPATYLSASPEQPQPPQPPATYPSASLGQSEPPQPPGQSEPPQPPATYQSASLGQSEPPQPPATYQSASLGQSERPQPPATYPPASQPPQPPATYVSASQPSQPPAIYQYPSSEQSVQQSQHPQIPHQPYPTAAAFINVTSWTVDDVCQWLNSEGFGRFTDTFRENAVDGGCLLSLDNDLLKNDLEITALGHRSQILRRIQQLKKGT